MEYGGYNVFVRTWWRWENNIRVPNAGKRRYIARGVAYERAREICRQYNLTHKRGPLSRMAEFERAE